MLPIVLFAGLASATCTTSCAVAPLSEGCATDEWPEDMGLPWEDLQTMRVLTYCHESCDPGALYGSPPSSVASDVPQLQDEAGTPIAATFERVESCLDEREEFTLQITIWEAQVDLEHDTVYSVDLPGHQPWPFETVEEPADPEELAPAGCSVVPAASWSILGVLLPLAVVRRRAT